MTVDTNRSKYSRPSISPSKREPPTDKYSVLTAGPSEIEKLDRFGLLASFTFITDCLSFKIAMISNSLAKV